MLNAPSPSLLREEKTSYIPSRSDLPRQRSSEIPLIIGGWKEGETSGNRITVTNSRISKHLAAIWPISLRQRESIHLSTKNLLSRERSDDTTSVPPIMCVLRSQRNDVSDCSNEHRPHFEIAILVFESQLLHSNQCQFCQWDSQFGWKTHIPILILSKKRQFPQISLSLTIKPTLLSRRITLLRYVNVCRAFHANRIPGQYIISQRNRTPT